MSIFRGQYAVARSTTRLPPNFVTTDLGQGFALHSHRDLPTAHSDGAALVGYALDWRCPERTQAEVLDWLLQDRNPASVARRSACLAGRWALIVPAAFALHDACGTMGVHWGAGAIASSARLLDYIAGPWRLIDRPGWREHQANFNSGHPISGTATEFEEVRALLANHWLDWIADQPVRFHPVERYPNLSADTVAPRIAEVLTGIIAAAAERTDIALGVTAGFDSRALAAAISNVPGLAAKALFYTFQDPFGCQPGHYDITTAHLVAKAAGGIYQVIVAIDPTPEATADCRSSEDMVATRFESWAATCRTPPLAGRLLLSGLCSETGRAFIRWEGSDQANARHILGCLGMAGFPEFLPDIEAWHSEAEAISGRCNIPTLDLFYWELRGPGWIGSTLNILNTGTDWIAVYSCRELLDLMLSVNESERGGKGQVLYRRMIEAIAPDLLKIPFNPRPPIAALRHFARTDLRNFAIRMAKRTGAYRLIRRRA